MVYRYNVEVTVSCNTIDTTRQLSYEELEKAVIQNTGIQKHLIRKINIQFKGDVTDWENARFGPNFNPDK
jgi:hypothetical protein